MPISMQLKERISLVHNVMLDNRMDYSDNNDL
jgi:hypothetical protein